MKLSETVKALISDSDQWHPEAECANHDPIPEGEFHYVMPQGARVVELTVEKRHEPRVRVRNIEAPAKTLQRFVSEWEDGERR